MKIFKNVLLALIIIVFANCEKKLPSTLTIVNVNLIDENDKPVEGYTFKITGSYPKGLSRLSTFSELIKTNKQGNLTFEKLITKPTKDISIAPVDDFLTEQILYKTKTGSFEKAGTFFFGIGVTNEFNYKLIKK